MNKENLIPISYVKKFTPLAVGDELYNDFTKSSWKIAANNCKAFNSIDNSYLYLVSFADRPNTGKQPVDDDVILSGKFKIGSFTDIQANYFNWNLKSQDAILSWKPSYDYMLEQYQSEQGANEMYTKQNTAAATAAKIWPGANPEAPYILKFFNFSGDNSLWLNNGKWEKFFSPLGEWSDETVNFLHRPEHEEKAAYTDENGIVTYAQPQIANTDKVLSLRNFADQETEQADFLRSCLILGKPEIFFYKKPTSGKYLDYLCPNLKVWQSSLTPIELIINDPNTVFLNFRDDGERVDLKYHDIDEDGKMTPVFTQEAHKAGELPPIGSECVVDAESFDDWHGKTVKVYSHDVKSNENVVLAGAEICSGGVTAVEWNIKYLKPIDNRTDDQKIRDEIISTIKSLSDMNVCYAAGTDAIATELMDKFTITLNKE
jgi:hypothetical protein